MKTVGRLFFAGVVALGGGYTSVCKTLNVVNPGFEDGKTGWTFQPNMSVDGTVAHSGRASAHVVMRDFMQDASVLTQLVPVTGGAQYVVSAWVKTADVKPVEARKVAPFGPRRLAFRRYEVKKLTENGKMASR